MGKEKRGTAVFLSLTRGAAPKRERMHVCCWGKTWKGFGGKKNRRAQLYARSRRNENQKRMGVKIQLCKKRMNAKPITLKKGQLGGKGEFAPIEPERKGVSQPKRKIERIREKRGSTSCRVREKRK